MSWEIPIILIMFLAVMVWAAGSRGQPRRFNHSLAISSLDGVRFRRPQPGDVHQIVALAREPHTMTANRWTEQEAREHEAFLLSDKFETFASMAVVATENSGAAIAVGSLGLRPGTTEPSIGIHTAAEHGGRGVGTELMRIMIQLTQDAYPGPAWVGTALDNHAMQQIMAKLGHEPQDGTEPYTAPNGETIQSLWYSVGTQPF